MVEVPEAWAPLAPPEELDDVVVEPMLPDR
jgi:hypothetical protein